MSQNIDEKTVQGFGEEWAKFDQGALQQQELRDLFEAYFNVFPWGDLPDQAIGFDLGCGSGRWAKCVAPRVGHLHCIDASAKALAVARRNLREIKNCTFHEASVDAIPLADESADFGYSLGVLHHVPDTLEGIKSCVAKLKPGAPFLVYLYYAFDNRPIWFRLLWKLSDSLRQVISKLPSQIKIPVCQLVALFVYFPLARTSWLLEKMGVKKISHLPLFAYRHLSLYSMRTDALDRFGTRLEQRFSAPEIKSLMESAGLKNIVFSSVLPYWCAVGYKR